MKYRIVTDEFLGYEAQFRPWWWPFWMQCFFVNTSPSVESSRKVVDKHRRGRIIEYYTPNTTAPAPGQEGGE